MKLQDFFARVGEFDHLIVALGRQSRCRPVLPGDGKPPVDRPLRDVFDTPDLAAMDDAIANGTLQRLPGAPEQLALFRAARVDYSLHRLYHYTGTDPEHFQNFVIFTNYQFYVDAFARLCHEHMASGHPSSDAFVEPGNVITRNAHGLGPLRRRSLRRGRGAMLA